MENSLLVDQKKLDEIRQFILSHPDIFRRQGAVVESWRTNQRKRRGPYFRLAFRDAGGKQRSIYLGPEHIANAVRALLAEQQRALFQRRQLARLQRSARAQLRWARRQWDRQLRQIGLRLHCSEIRGLRGWRPDTAMHALPQRTDE